MKKQLLLFLFFCCMKAAIAQTYQAFPTDSAVWRQTSKQHFSPNLEVWEYKYFISGDTVLTGNQFYKIYRTGTYSTYNTGGPWGPVLTGGPYPSEYNKYIGSLREDGLKHVYFIDDTASVEQLLYDFNIGVGDTIAGTYNLSYATIIVNSIDSVLLNSVYHKRYNLFSVGDGYACGSIIEGVGSTFGLLEKIVGVPFEHVDYLRCYTRNEEILYTDGSFTSCELPLHVSITENTAAIEMNVFPNPVSEQLNIHVFPFEKTNIVLVDVLGNIVYKAALLSSDTRLNLSEMPKGIYFLQAFSDTELLSARKIVLQ